MECRLNGQTQAYCNLDPGIDGWMTAEELQWLYETACEMTNIVEIGSWMGKSTHALLSGCRGTVYAVDHFRGSRTERDGVHKLALTEDIHGIFQKNVGGFKNLVTLRMDSLDAAKLFGNKWVDMVFIDGSHESEDFKADVIAWLPKCRRILCGHDLYDKRVNRAIRELDLPYGYENPTWTIWSIRL